MARTRARPEATAQRHLAPVCDHCWVCGHALWITDTNQRTVTTLGGLVACTLQIRSCPNRACERYRRPYRPEAEGTLALPHAEFGLEVIASVGTRRFAFASERPGDPPGVERAGGGDRRTHRHRSAPPLRGTGGGSPR